MTFSFPGTNRTNGENHDDGDIYTNDMNKINKAARIHSLSRQLTGTTVLTNKNTFVIHLQRFYQSNKISNGNMAQEWYRWVDLLNRNTLFWKKKTVELPLF